ncbi:SEC14 cytosolic factor family protein / phosphoglyceride transfer family protein, partial [Zea mays]
MCSHHATAALNCSPHRARAAIHASPPHPSIHGGRRNPSLPHRARSLGSARPRLLLATPSSSSFPCHHLFPSHDVPHGFTTANEPRLHRRLLGPAGSRSPTRSHPLRTLSSSSFVAAGTSFEKRSIDLVDHGRYGAAHPRAPGMATRSAAASKREGRRSQQQLDPVGDEERAGADDRHVSPNLSQPHASPSLRLSLNNTQNPSSIPTLPGVRAPTTRLRPDLPSRVPGWGRRWRCHGANTVGGSHNRSRWTDTIGFK